jgi:hypothetical protein
MIPLRSFSKLIWHSPIRWSVVNFLSIIVNSRLSARVGP